MNIAKDIRQQEARRRRIRLAELIRLHFNDKQAEFVAHINGNQGEISALVSNEEKSFGSVKARGLEQRAGLLHGSLDAEEGQPFYPPVKSASRERQSSTRDDQATPSPHYNPPAGGDNFEPGPDLKARRYPEISWVQAGMWTELCDNFLPDEDTKWHQCHIDLGPCGFVVSVRGPSMTAPPGEDYSFPNGIKLFVSPHAEALPGKFVIVRRNNKATFKKLTLVDGDLYLEALNPDWPERYIKVRDDDCFCGVVRHAGFDV